MQNCMMYEAGVDGKRAGRIYCLLQKCMLFCTSLYPVLWGFHGRLVYPHDTCNFA